MKWKNRDARQDPPTSALWGSVLVHGAVLAVAVALSFARPEPLDFVTYEIEIVSPPPARAEEEQVAAPPEDLEIETPDDPEIAETPPPDPVEEPPEIPPPDPQTEPEPEETPPETPPDSVPTETTTSEEAEEAPEETGEDIEVRMEGLKRDYPVYYRNIITQIDRCWRPPRNVPEGLSATIYFVIRPDGTVTDVRPVERSGSVLFDGRAMEAIGGCATGRFGPLPDDLPYDRLPIQFTFSPAGDAPSATPPTHPDA